MKKLTLTAVLVIAAIVMGCASSGGAQAPQGEPTVVLINLDTGFIKDGKPLDETDIEFGRGWIVGEQFKQVISAKTGSFIRLTVTGTKNLNWNTIGAVGIKKMEDQEKRVDFGPKPGGTYTVDITVRALLSAIRSEKEAIGVNIWGDHKIDKVELYMY